MPTSLVPVRACVDVREECGSANVWSSQALVADALMSDDVPRTRAHTPHSCVVACLLEPGS
jgi:hypothetical protein